VSVGSVGKIKQHTIRDVHCLEARQSLTLRAGTVNNIAERGFRIADWKAEFKLLIHSTLQRLWFIFTLRLQREKQFHAGGAKRRRKALEG
jgi:hypothetical protein